MFKMCTTSEICSDKANVSTKTSKLGQTLPTDLAASSRVEDGESKSGVILLNGAAADSFYGNVGKGTETLLKSKLTYRGSSGGPDLSVERKKWKNKNFLT